MRTFGKRAAMVLLLLSLLLMQMIPVLASGNIVKPGQYYYVLDDANVLSADTEAHIILNNDELKSACGGQIVFVTVDYTGSLTSEDYAYNLFNEWQIGDAEKQNGVLVLLVIGAEDYFMQSGRGIDAYMSAGDMSNLSNKYLEADFARGDYDEGAKKLFDALYKEVANAYDVSPRVKNYTAADLNAPTQAATKRAGGGGTSGGGYSFDNILIAIVVIIVILWIVKSMFKSSYNRPGRSSGGNFGGSFMGSMFGSMMSEAMRANRNTNRKRRNNWPGDGGFGGFGGGGFGGGGRSGGGGFGGSRGGGGGSARGGGGAGRGR